MVEFRARFFLLAFQLNLISGDINSFKRELTLRLKIEDWETRLCCMPCRTFRTQFQDNLWQQFTIPTRQMKQNYIS